MQPTTHASHAQRSTATRRIPPRERNGIASLALAMLVLFAANCRTPQPTPQAAAPAPVRASGPPYLGILYSTGSPASGSYGAGRDPYATHDRGARIVEVLPSSPAERAGLRIGDTIVSANGEPIIGGNSLNLQIRTMRPGDTLQLVVIRTNGSREIVPAQLEPLPPELAN